MLRFAEAKLSCKENNERVLNIRVDINDRELKQIVQENGYKKSDMKESTSSMLLENQKNVELQPGFRIADGFEVSSMQRAAAHINAFEISETHKDTRIIANTSLRLSPDYDPSLDLSMVNNKNEVVSFATIWFDEKNKIGIFEPVGTVPEYRKKGMGKAVIYAGINKLLQLGCRKVYVGSDQSFYRSLGFSIDFQKEIWQKRWVNN